MADIERAELLRTWVAALRSGKYGQTKWALKDGTGYCCLGVLCDVVGVAFEAPNGRGRAFASDDSDVQRAIVAALGEEGWRRRGELAQMNDVLGFSFSEIADRIEAMNPDVFGEKVERGEGVEDAYLGADASALELVEAGV